MNAASELVRMFERAGFVLARRSGHAIWRCPCGHAQVTSAVSPGKGRAFANAQSQVARTLRACKPIEQRRAA